MCFFIFREVERSSPNIKKCLIYCQQKAFLIFLEMETSHPPKKKNKNKNKRRSLYFRKQNFLVFQEKNFQARKMKNKKKKKKEMFFLSGTLFLCCCTASATVLRELFLTHRRFLPDTSSRSLKQPAFIEAFLGVGSFPWKFQALSLRFETQTQPISLFESQTAQQKLLVGRFYRCVKVLRNTISNSPRFWTYSVITTYIVRCMSYPLDQRSY